MNLKEVNLLNEMGRGRLALLRAGSDVPAEKIVPFGYFELDMFECPPFLMFSSGDVPVLVYVLDNGTFEPGSMALWCRLAKTATGFLDIGANVGIYSLAAAKLRPDVQIHAYEPNPYAYARLRVHKFVNDLPNLIEHSSAVHPESGVGMFAWFIKPHGNIASGASLRHQAGAGKESAPVRVEPIDGTGIAATLGARPLVKMDVEGSEAKVFSAMTEVVALRPDIILETFSQNACDAINATLLPLGYSVYEVQEDTKTLRSKPRLTPCSLKNPTHNFNQFLTVRQPAEIQNIIRLS